MTDKKLIARVSLTEDDLLQLTALLNGEDRGRVWTPLEKQVLNRKLINSLNKIIIMKLQR